MDHFKRLRILFFVHGLITLAAAIVLTVAPGLIPSVVGIHFDSSSNLIAYLLAGAEFGFAVLSFGGSRMTDVRALRLIVWTLVAFHGASGALEGYAYLTGTSRTILANIAARVIIIFLFVIFSRERRQVGLPANRRQ